MTAAAWQSDVGGTVSDSSILVSRDGFVATVVLNRPEKLNALTKSMWRALGEAVTRFSADDSVRCVVLRGAGEKAFSPGNDIGEFATERSNKAQAIEYGAIMHATAQALENCRHPIVAQIHGICVGGGLEIASLADIRICGESSRFGAPIKNLGLVMAYAEMAPLVRLVGRAVALEILLEGRIFDAAEAREKGLVTRDESNRTHIYQPVGNQERTRQQLVRNLLDRAFEGSAKTLVMQALSANEASAEELKEIRNLLDSLERNLK